MKIRPVGAELFLGDGQTQTYIQTDRQTDRKIHDEANSRFSQFCELA